MLDIIKSLKEVTDEKERLKQSLILSAKNVVLDPIALVLGGISPKIYYTIFKEINKGKIKILKELEDNFRGFNFNSF